MIFTSTRKFDKQFKKLPEDIKKAFQKQIGFLLLGNNHPSLNIKKIQGKIDVWEARISRSYRFTFKVENKIINLRTIGSHDILNKL